MSHPLPLLLSDRDPALPLSPLPPIPGLTPAALFGSVTCPSCQLAMLSGLLLSWPFLNFSPIFTPASWVRIVTQRAEEGMRLWRPLMGPYLHSHVAPQGFSDLPTLRPARRSQCSTIVSTPVLPGRGTPHWHLCFQQGHLYMNADDACHVRRPGSPAVFEARSGLLNFSTPPSQLSHLGPGGFCIVLGSSRGEWGTSVLGARGTCVNLSPAPPPCRLLGIGNPT